MSAAAVPLEVAAAGCAAATASAAASSTDAIAASVAHDESDDDAPLALPPYSATLTVATAVAGARHYAASNTPLPPGTILRYAREVHNPRDPNAIRLFLPADDAEDAAMSDASVVPPSRLSVGHLPAGLARRLSAVIVLGLITLQVRVAAPAAAAKLDEDEAMPEDGGDATAPSFSHATAAAPNKGGPRIDLVVDIVPVGLDDPERGPFTTAACTLWRDLELLVAMSASASQQTYDERLASNFALVARTATAVYKHIFLEDEIAAVHHFLSLSFEAQRFFIRLFNRVRPHRWHSMAALRFPFDIQAPIEQLSQASASSDASTAAVAATPPTFKRSATCPSIEPSSALLPSISVASTTSFVERASSLSIEAWSSALPSILRELTIAAVKELIIALGLKSKLGNLSQGSPKELLIAHLTTQRTLFSASMLACPKTRRAVMDACGDFVRLSPSFLTICQRLHRLFFLQDDPSQSSPMKLEEVGLFRWFKSPALRATFDEANHQANSSSSSFSSDPALSNPSPPFWCLFPTRECFLAYDVAVQFLLHMQAACESVLLTGEARKQNASFSPDQALQLLAEAKRRLDMETASPYSTAALEAISAPTAPAPPTAKLTPFQRAKSLPLAASTNAHSSAPTFLTGPSYSDFTASYAASSPPPDDAAHPFAMSYRARSVYVSCVHYGLRVLERLKRHVEANSLLLGLLSQPYCGHRRGTWWNRLALNLETHAKEHALAYRMARLGIEDPFVRCGDLHELRGRVRRLWKHRDMTGANKEIECPAPPQPDFSRPRALQGTAKSNKKGSVAASVPLNEDDAYSSVVSDGVILSTIRAAPTNSHTGVHSRFYGFDNEACRVEDLALSYYAKAEFGAYTGRHDEGSLLHALFVLLCWDVIFEWKSVPHVWQTHYQDAPLDLCSDTFYMDRRELIDSTLASIRNCTDLSTLLGDSWTAHHGMRVRDLNWRGDLSLSQLQELAECMGGTALAAMCEVLAKDFGGWSGGLPDLCLWRPGVKPEMKKVTGQNFNARITSPVKVGSIAPSARLPTSASSSPTSVIAVAQPASRPQPDIICISSDDDDVVAPHSALARVPPPPATRKRSAIKPTASDRKKRPKTMLLSPTKPTMDSAQQSLLTFSTMASSSAPSASSTSSSRGLMAGDDSDDDVVCTGAAWTEPAEWSLPAAASWPSAKLVEIKGPNDRLSSQQSAWLQQLATFMAVEVCYVVTPDVPKP